MTVCLKACKRCGGDMSYECDIYGWFRQCLQCSYLEDLPSDAASTPANEQEHAPQSVVVTVQKDSIAEETSDVS